MSDIKMNIRVTAEGRQPFCLTNIEGRGKFVGLNQIEIDRAKIEAFYPGNVKAEDFAVLVNQMREAQTKYFAASKQADYKAARFWLAESKKLESKIDRLTDVIFAKPKIQTTLL